jgi:hypothetical protein
MLTLPIAWAQWLRVKHSVVLSSPIEASAVVGGHHDAVYQDRVTSPQAGPLARPTSGITTSPSIKLPIVLAGRRRQG